MQERSPEERFAEIYDRHLAAVSAYVRRRTAADDAADIVSDTFLVCWQKLERVPAEPLPWLYAVARNTLANHRRSAARRQTPLPAVEIAGDPALPGDPILGIAFARIAEADREVLRLVAWEGLSIGAAAAVLGCSPVACRVRLHRAKRRLASRLQELETASAAASSSLPDPKGATP